MMNPQWNRTYNKYYESLILIKLINNFLGQKNLKVLEIVEFLGRKRKQKKSALYNAKFLSTKISKMHLKNHYQIDFETIDYTQKKKIIEIIANIK